MRLGPLVEALRLPHWIKNTFVFAPLVFGLKFTDPQALVRVVGAFFAFALAASATYLINDVVDRDRDKENPRTKHRPVARGALRPPTAVALAVLLTTAAGALGLASGVLAFLIGYVVTSHTYSLVLKRVFLADVMAIASLYLLRLLAGAAAAQLPPSPWLLTCGGLLALLLALGKRFERQNGHYSEKALRAGMRALLFATAFAYALYSVQPGTWHTFTPWFVLTNLPVLAGLYRYWLAMKSGGADPTEALFGDARLKLYVILWGALILWLALRALYWS